SKCFNDDVQMLFSLLSTSNLNLFQNSKCQIQRRDVAKLFECLQTTSEILSLNTDEIVERVEKFEKINWLDCEISTFPWRGEFYTYNSEND
ncbi:MAG: hypothetical protein MHPSP_004938, partial [Paramarteilia canceri]